MRVLCFSSFTFSYLDRAKVLFKSIRRYHPSWTLVAVITDIAPEDVIIDLPSELFDEVVFSDDLDIPDVKGWIFQHDIVEISTAVKGPFLSKACRLGADVIVYLDPDTCLFAELTPVIDALGSADIVLTPHQLAPESTRTAIIDNEITSLRTGIYNLGFIAINTTGDGLRFADWWATRLLQFCHDDVSSGLFVDQRWCDHVPVFFEQTKILRDPGLNVASWNLSNRKVEFDDEGSIRVNGSLLRFWHFTKLGPTGDFMTRRYAKDNFEVYEVWNWYRRAVESERVPGLPATYWAYGMYADGTLIRRSHRLLYRDRADLRKSFKDPFECGSYSYRDWLIKEGLY